MWLKVALCCEKHLVLLLGRGRSVSEQKVVVFE